jgi:WD40 repeat protein
MKKLLFSLGILILICYSASADQVVLKDGGIIQGKILKQNNETVTVEDIDGVRSSFRMGNVKKIVKESRGLAPVENAPGTAAQTNVPPELVIQNGHSNIVSSVAFSPDGKTLASGSWDNTIKLWDVETGEIVRTLEGHSSRVTSVAFSHDGKTLA